MEFYIQLPMSYGNLTSNCLGHTIPFNVLNVLYTQKYTFQTFLEKNFLVDGLPMIYQCLAPTIPISQPWTSSCRNR
jgi:hypothetical protein